MKKSRFSVEKIISILEEAESGVDTVKGICRKHRISGATFYNWRNKYSGLSVSEAQKA